VLPVWARTDPLDPGTKQVVSEGLIPLYDPDGLLANATQRCRAVSKLTHYPRPGGASFNLDADAPRSYPTSPGGYCWVMSRENVENLRAFVETWVPEAWTMEAWQRGELDVSLLDPDIIYEDTILPDRAGEIYRGHEGVVRSTERLFDVAEWMVVDLEQILEAGDRVVSIHRVRAKARYTGIEFEMRMAYVWTFRDGKVIHYRSFRDPQRAIEAASLPE
jgi:ketosteroid isomerase-like protein